MKETKPKIGDYILTEKSKTGSNYYKDIENSVLKVVSYDGDRYFRASFNEVNDWGFAFDNSENIILEYFLLSPALEIMFGVDL